MIDDFICAHVIPLSTFHLFKASSFSSNVEMSGGNQIMADSQPHPSFNGSPQQQQHQQHQQQQQQQHQSQQQYKLSPSGQTLLGAAVRNQNKDVAMTKPQQSADIRLPASVAAFQTDTAPNVASNPATYNPSSLQSAEPKESYFSNLSKSNAHFGNKPSQKISSSSSIAPRCGSVGAGSKAGCDSTMNGSMSKNNTIRGNSGGDKGNGGSIGSGMVNFGVGLSGSVIGKINSANIGLSRSIISNSANIVSNSKLIKTNQGVAKKSKDKKSGSPKGCTQCQV